MPRLRVWPTNCLNNSWPMRDETADCHRHECIREPSDPREIHTGPSGRAGLERCDYASLSSHLEELRMVLRRQKLARYIQSGKIEPFIARVWELALYISNPPPICACRDPRDDKFMEVAVHGRADAIVTGDVDLLALTH